MLDFEVPRLEDGSSIRSAVEQTALFGNDLSFANIYLLRAKHKITICFQDGFFFRHYAGRNRSGYAFPVGSGNPSEAIRAIEDDARARCRLFSFCMLTAEQKSILEAIRPGQFHFSTDSGDSDYIYSRDAIALLTGRRFHRKRNAIARFENDFPFWHFERLTARNLQEAATVAERWFTARGPELEFSLVAERAAIQNAVTNFEALELTGGLLYVDSIPRAMSIVSPITQNVYDVHFEKTDPEYSNAYSILGREMARLLADTRFLNREEDLNLPGLRTAKLSWFPEFILTKYTAVPLDSEQDRLFCEKER